MHHHMASCGHAHTSMGIQAMIRSMQMCITVWMYQSELLMRIDCAVNSLDGASVEGPVVFSLTCASMILNDKVGYVSGLFTQLT